MTGLEHRFHDGRPDAPVLLLLHGTGGGPDDLVGLGTRLSPGSPLLAPAGPVREHGARRWFRRHAEGVFDTADVIARAGELAEFVHAARDRYGLAGRRLVAVGFSNGANIAAAVTLLHPDALREAVLFAAMSPVPDPPRHDLGGSRVFLAGGERDPMAPLPSAERLVADLRERGADVTIHRHPGGHQVTPDAVHAAAEWLR
ncbi:phospholipase/carboxylesterase [Amycolatopsis arida]|uniref:Phospholipase/carboxylesterase n=1 Tax=Amycolatopsis arida TaxID=587909 RepID=A0A1I5QVK1_9PSEU|nr:alpha/beta hydrolase [Amycolatopsis arida]TDX98978.1 phospholipase/carboxylesterase [Amycolatopsis arida]SFP50262.1 phospholipase/carboxylesterase [Amycolatopsis arida]